MSHSIITKGYGTNQYIITKGYSPGTIVLISANTSTASAYTLGVTLDLGLILTPDHLVLAKGYPKLQRVNVREKVVIVNGKMYYRVNSSKFYIGLN